MLANTLLHKLEINEKCSYYATATMYIIIIIQRQHMVGAYQSMIWTDLMILGYNGHELLNRSFYLLELQKFTKIEIMSEV